MTGGASLQPVPSPAGRPQARRLGRAADVFGRLRRTTPTLLSVGLADAIAYRGEMLIWLLTANTPLIMLLLWNAVASEAPIGRYGQRQFAAYFLTTMVVRLLTGAWVMWQVNYEVRQGVLNARLLRPLHPFLAYAAEHIGAWPLRWFICLPVAITVLLVLGPQAYGATSWQAWVAWPVSVLGSWLVGFASMFLIGTLSLRWHSSTAIFEVWLGAYFVMSGYVVPLDLFPARLQTALELLPFAYQISFPVRLALGEVAPAQVLPGLGVQWAYALVFMLLGLVSWRRGLRYYEAFGG